MSEENAFKKLVPYELSSPEFLKRLQCDEAQEGNTARLACQVIGDPVPKIQWFKEDLSEIDPAVNNRYEIRYDLTSGEAELLIKNVLRSDEMTYKCVASNKYGTCKTIGVLMVKASKSVKSPSRSLEPPKSPNRCLSPLRNIDVPPSNLQTVKEETEVSSQSEDATETLNKLKDNSSLNEDKIEGCQLLTQPPLLIQVKEGEDIKISCEILGKFIFNFL